MIQRLRGKLVSLNLKLCPSWWCMYCILIDAPLECIYVQSWQIGVIWSIVGKYFGNCMVQWWSVKKPRSHDLTACSICTDLHTIQPWQIGVTYDSFLESTLLTVNMNVWSSVFTVSNYGFSWQCPRFMFQLITFHTGFWVSTERPNTMQHWVNTIAMQMR